MQDTSFPCSAWKRIGKLLKASCPYVTPVELSLNRWYPVGTDRLLKASSPYATPVGLATNPMLTASVGMGHGNVQFELFDYEVSLPDTPHIYQFSMQKTRPLALLGFF